MGWSVKHSQQFSRLIKVKKFIQNLRRFRYISNMGRSKGIFVSILMVYSLKASLNVNSRYRGAEKSPQVNFIVNLQFQFSPTEM